MNDPLGLSNFAHSNTMAKNEAHLIMTKHFFQIFAKKKFPRSVQGYFGANLIKN